MHVAAAGDAAKEGAMKHVYKFSGKELARMLTQAAVDDENTPPGHYDSSVEFSWDEKTDKLCAVVTITTGDKTDNDSIN